MSREFRHACPADVAALAFLDAAVNFNPWSERQFAVVCAGASGDAVSTVVVEEEGRLDGFIVFSQVLDEASIHNIAVAAAHQGKGLGRQLLQAALAQMKGSGATRCLLEVRESNTAARQLYAGNGFQLDGVRKNYYPSEGGREDALLMSREL